ncbi:helix-turn-helix domain-containing protein [Paraherbaspirillum soli]|uniref:Helix-turn-helix domain-containing protein n=1 Tax=Paraherbaspirillum soli TaxID=631222 RepID=A0ABW0M7U4_9BURK
MRTDIRSKTVSNAIAREIKTVAERCGIGPAEFSRLTGIQAHELAETGARIAGGKHLKMLRLMDRLAYVPQLDSDSLQDLFPFFPDFAALAACSRNGRDALNNYISYRYAIGELDFVSLRHAPDRIEIDYINEGEGEPPRSAASALGNFLIVAKIIRHYLPRAGHRIQIDLQGRLATPPHVIESRIDAQVRFQQMHNRLLCISADLDAPYASFNQMLNRYVHGKLEAERRRSMLRETFSAQAESAILGLLRCSAPEAGTDDMLAMLCQQFHISRWTVLRRLKHENSSFESLLSRVRSIETRRLLEETQLSIGEISDRIGFASPSSLSRFFKAQWGVSPTQHRAKLRG